MAEEPDSGVALLSVHPRFARALLAGEKGVELRRTHFSRDLSHVVLYATAPVKRIVGWFEVAGVDRATPEAIWTGHGRHSGLTREEFLSYYRGKQLGTVIRVRSATPLARPAPLSAVGAARPPQGIQYLPGYVLKRLAERVTSKAPAF